MSKLIVIAIGGNSLIKDEKHESVYDQYHAVAETCSHIIKLVKKGYKLVITHGNGPQVGFILRRSELARKELHMVPLDSCVADTQGAIGYNIQMALYNEIVKHKLKVNVATVVTQVVVDAKDPSLQKPSKPIGYFMTKEEAEVHVKDDNWNVVQDANRGYRRVVPSPKPEEIIEIETIKNLLNKNSIVIAAGGGGIPVVKARNGQIKGVEGVIDKDLVSALLSKNINADTLLISTAVEKVYLNFGMKDEKALSKMTLTEAKKYVAEGHFAPGSMLPKINAMIDFVASTGGTAYISNPENLINTLDGKTGTKLVP